MESHKSIFSLLGRNMQAYTISWATTFFSSIVNVVWSVYVFHFDFVSNIDGALASQIGVVLLNELFLLYSVFISRKYLFGIGAIVNSLWIALTAAFICLLIYAPMLAFKIYAAFVGVEINGHSPLYDEINSYSDALITFASHATPANVASLHIQYDGLLGRIIGAVSGLIAVVCLLSFFRRKRA